MGTTALLVLLAVLGVALLSLAALAWSALRIYRTLRYAYKDAQPWIELFKRHADALTDQARLMEERARNISRAGGEIRESIDDIRDAVEELRSHPLLRGARFLGRFRR